MGKQKPLTPKQAEALSNAQDGLFGDRKLMDGYGRQVRGLRQKGLVEGENPHVYVTQAGRDATH